MTAFGVKKY